MIYLWSPSIIYVTCKNNDCVETTVVAQFPIDSREKSRKITKLALLDYDVNQTNVLVKSVVTFLHAEKVSSILHSREGTHTKKSDNIKMVLILFRLLHLCLSLCWRVFLCPVEHDIPRCFDPALRLLFCNLEKACLPHIPKIVSIQRNRFNTTVVNSKTLSSFKAGLKIHLFKRAFAYV